MFNYTIDQKPNVVDKNGNTIKDLASSIFRRAANLVNRYTLKRMASHAVMRPDIVALSEYGSTEYTEYILKYSGISNPFTLDEDDILLIPDEDDADAQMVANHPDKTNNSDGNAAAFKNYYKFVNQDYKKDSTSYEQLANKEIKSAIVNSNGTLSGDFVVPYISFDDKTAVSIRNGRIFFGDDTGMGTNEIINAAASNLDQKIQALVDSTATTLSDKNCMYNGMTLADFVSSTMKKQ